jgi:ribose 5-phosphate isomerase B
MKIAIGTDHAGYDFKETLKAYLASKGHAVEDLGAHSKERCDYPDFARKVGEAVTSGKAQLGVLICGSGIGMSIAANKVRGVRAALIHDLYTARMCRAHNDANVVVLPARLIAMEIAQEMMDLAIATPFEGDRHAGRLKKIEGIEDAYCR